jgi:hypothetical protein
MMNWSGFKTEITLSPRRRKPCGAFSPSPHAEKSGSSMEGDGNGVDLDEVEVALPLPADEIIALDEALDANYRLPMSDWIAC